MCHAAHFGGRQGGIFADGIGQLLFRGEEVAHVGTELEQRVVPHPLCVQVACQSGVGKDVFLEEEGGLFMTTRTLPLTPPKGGE